MTKSCVVNWIGVYNGFNQPFNTLLCLPCKQRSEALIYLPSHYTELQFQSMANSKGKKDSLNYFSCLFHQTSFKTNLFIHQRQCQFLLHAFLKYILNYKIQRLSFGGFRTNILKWNNISVFTKVQSAIVSLKCGL